MTVTEARSAYYDRLADLAGAARETRREFDAPASPPDEERAMELLRTGFGPTVALYVEARTADRDVVFSAAELSLFHRAVNDWLDLYARAYGVDLEADVTVREAAQALLDTHHVGDTAQLLTRVPPRRTVK